jgi:phosphinothricin acetyltransferase
MPGFARIRPYEAADLEPTRAIYNDAVETSTASWDWEPLDSEQWGAWVAAHSSGRHVLLVAESNGVVLGFAGYGPFRAKIGYVDTVESSIYLRPEARGQDLGSRLLGALLEEARGHGFHVVIAALATENTVSQALHRKLGFSMAGVLPQVGQKFGRWLDLVLYQSLLDDRPAPRTERADL